MTYQQKDFNHLLGITGFSDNLFTNHFTLYGGYVKNVNTIIESLKALKTGTPEYNELKRRFGWEWNGVKMHELYFENLSKKETSTNANSPFEQALTRDFGSFENWSDDFKNTGLVRGIGWVALVKNRENGTLMNIWIGEHDEGLLCNQEIVLIMDVWEHAYITDYGIKKADYINAFLERINWKEVEKRFGN